MRKVYVDVSMVMIGTKYTGIPRVVMELVKRINEDKEIEFVLIEYNFAKDAFELIDTDKFILLCNHGKVNRRKMRTGRYKAFDEIESGSVFFDVDSVWKTRVRRSFLYPILKKNGVIIKPLIHDIIGITHPAFCASDDVLCFVDYIGATLDYADEIVVTSRTTKKYICDLCEKIGHDIPKFAIEPLGGNFSKKEYDDSDVSSEVKNIADNGKFVLMVGTVEPRKNHKLILDAYDLGMNDDMQVVFAGFVGQGMEKLTERIAAYREKGAKVWHLDSASDADIDYLYRHCFALTFPSYIEGYGLPIIEALMRGVIVIAADTDINKEIGGDNAIYFRQDSPEDLRDKVNSLLADETRQQELKRLIAGYEPPMWEKTATGIAEVLKD